MNSLQTQVILFHKGFDHPIADRPTLIADDRVRLRATLIAEEFIETLAAMFPTDGAKQRLSIAHEIITSVIARGAPAVLLTELADGLADLDFVVEGTRLEFGIEGGAIAAAVFTTNMQKLTQCTACGGRGTIDDAVCSNCRGYGRFALKRADGKTVKPIGWTPPDIAGLLRDQQDGNALTVGEIATRL